MVAALVALGSNVGDRGRSLAQAVEQLAAHPAISVLAPSRWHATQPVGGPGEQPEFLNGATVLETTLSAVQLFAVLQAIEHAAGRERAVRWGPRTLDLDLLLYGDEIVQTPDLIVPHPRLAFRRFVLEPAAEVAPDFVHPTIGWTIARLRDHVRDAIPYIAMAGPRSAEKSRLAEAAANAVGGVFLFDPANDVVAGGPSPIPSLSRELQSLASRARQISRINWPYGDRPVISDYWIGDAQATADAMPCKLLALFGAEPVRNVGPYVSLDASHPAAALEELIAAIQAMQP